MMDSYVFYIRARQDAVIALHFSASEFYLVAIGGWGNTKSFIRLLNEGQTRKQMDEVKAVAAHAEGGILNENEFRHFWVSWRHGVITAGECFFFNQKAKL